MAGRKRSWRVSNQTWLTFRTFTTAPHVSCLARVVASRSDVLKLNYFSLPPADYSAVQKEPLQHGTDIQKPTIKSSSTCPSLFIEIVWLSHQKLHIRGFPCSPLNHSLYFHLDQRATGTCTPQLTSSSSLSSDKFVICWRAVSVFEKKYFYAR